MTMLPASIAEASAALRELPGPAMILGAGTKQRFSAEHVIGTARLDRVVEYVPADQVITAEAGVTLQALQAELSRNGQRLSLDPPFAARATIGGIVAAASSGPLRARYGAVRDLIIGATMVRPDGVVAKGGGKVVKNVAGFDLPKLLCGSFGTLGLVATATFRVHPLPEATAVLRAVQLSSAGVLEQVRRLRALQLEPSALLATRRGPGLFDLDLLFEGFEKSLQQQLGKLPELQRVDRAAFDEHARQREACVAFAALPTELALHEPRVQGAFSWYPTLGLGFCDGPAQERPIPSLALHRAIKQRFDPRGLLPSLV